MRSGASRPVLGATVVLACVAAWGAEGAHAAFPGRDGTLAYNLRGPSTPEEESPGGSPIRLGTVGPDGAGNRLLPCSTAPPARCLDSEPAYSPDGGRIVFVSATVSPAGPPHLAVADADGANVRRLSVCGREPVFSPDGRRIAFASRAADTRCGGDRQIAATDVFTVHADGSGLRRLTFRGGGEPSWSSRGRIAFTRPVHRTSGRFARIDVFSIRASGRGLRRVTYRGGSSADWSPRGSRIAFERNGDVHLLRVPRGRVRRLTAGGGRAPAWSPDGRSIAFQRPFGEENVYLTGTDGRGLRQVVGGAVNASWQPLR